MIDKLRPLVRVTVALVTAVLCDAQSAAAEPVTTIRNNGSSANRVDIVILGDGFTAAEISSGFYEQRVETFVQGWMAQEPYLEYRNYFNVHRVDVTSAQSGADHPELSSFRDTAFDGTYNCSGIQRLICVNTTKVNTVISNSGLPANMRDIVLVLVNDTEYGGSGGSVAVASLHASAVELILHEVGHSFGLLADEYGGPPPPSCTLTEPSAANATVETQRAAIKWTAWIDAGTPLPTTGTANGVPGLYQGAQYCDSGKYRPTYNSKMRSLGQPFEQINTEQHVRRIYNFASPIDSFSPSSTTPSITVGQTITFSAAAPSPRTHALAYAWRLNGVLAGSGSSYAPTGLAPGTHQVTLTLSDATTMVRNDPSVLLTDTQAWTLTVAGFTFTDDPLTAGTLVRAVHVEELRTAVNTRRASAGLSSMTWTDATLAAGTTLARAVHITELRDAIAAVYTARGAAPPTFTDSSLSGVPIKVVHISELRAAVNNAP